jgi:enediyne biosynthesis protein E4
MLVDSTTTLLGDPIGVGRPAGDLVGGGVALGDLDGDDDLDLVVATALDSPAGGSLLLVNEPSRGAYRFASDSEFTDLTQGRNAVGVALGDYDRDGDLDVFLACAGKDLLLRNDDMEFVDIADALGVAGAEDDITTGAIWTDLNGDGWLDLYVANFMDFQQELSADVPLSQSSVNHLFLNTIDGFSDVTESLNMTQPGATHALAAVDLDDDGLLELFALNDTLSIDDEVRHSGKLPRDQVYVVTSVGANGVPVVEERAQALGLGAFRASMGIEFFDLDRDGRDELYISDYGSNDLYFWNDEHDVYVNRAEDWNLAMRHGFAGRPEVHWSLHALDLNRDLRWEVFSVNGAVMGSDAQRSSFVEQSELGGRFGSLTENGGLDAIPNSENLPQPRGGYRGDLDSDGDDDFVLSSVGGDFRILENRTKAVGEALRLRLVGSVSAPDPIGARVKLVWEDGARNVLRRFAGGPPFGQNDAALEAVTRTTQSAELRVYWPSGFVQRLSAEPGPDVVKIKEPNWLEIDPPRVAPEDSATLTLRSLSPEGEAMGEDGAGRKFRIERSDGLEVEVRDEGDGTYRALLSHPGAPTTVWLQILEDDEPMRIRPAIRFE